MQTYISRWIFRSRKNNSHYSSSTLFAKARGLMWAVVTNDQGDSLVDTQHIENHRIVVGEVTGGCFCCNYNQLATVLETV